MRPLGVALSALVFCAQAAWGQGPADPAALMDKLKAVRSDPVALKAAVEAGRKASFFCANCHGEDGNSKDSSVPNLAGQNPAYLLEQIRKFGTGERKNDFMQGLIKVLKDDERVQISLSYSEAKVPPSPADPVQAARGKELYGKLCMRCHGEQARGNETIPRLAGQRVPYLRTSITRYRDRTGERNNPLMTIATATLKNEDVAAIANYLTQLP